MLLAREYKWGELQLGPAFGLPIGIWLVTVGMRYVFGPQQSSFYVLKTLT